MAGADGAERDETVIRLENSHIFTLAPEWKAIHGSLEIRGGRIHAFGPQLPPASPDTECIDMEGAWILPGFVQGHTHLCQTLFRGLAEGLPLDRWLAERIWPLEGAHTARSVWASARLGIAELISSGTTSVLDMGTVHHTENVGRALEETHFSGIIGKAIMDNGDDVPEGLLESTDKALGSAVELAEAWGGRGEGRIGACLAPRFVLSVSRKAWRRIREIRDGRGLRVHTHACETPWENRMSRQRLRRTPIAFLQSQGLLGPTTTLVHAVWVGRREEGWLSETETRVVHCPSSNLKLGSGLAAVSRFRRSGISVGLGCDGAACNNQLDAFEEMRRALLVSAILAGPGSMTARDALEMATQGGAAALGWDGYVGKLEPGRRADLVALRPWGDPEDHPDPHETIVQEGHPGRVGRVYVAGRLLYKDGEFLTLNIEDVIDQAQEERNSLLSRLGWPASSLPVRSVWADAEAGSPS
jgi:5-methylthioadenosine/S-adenosylhomocysteine deaminase